MRLNESSSIYKRMLMSEKLLIKNELKHGRIKVHKEGNHGINSAPQHRSMPIYYRTNKAMVNALVLLRSNITLFGKDQPELMKHIISTGNKKK